MKIKHWHWIWILQIMKRLFLLLSCFICFQASSQKPKVLCATETSWSGGIAGRMGSSYNMTIQFSVPLSKIKLDTLWIDKNYFPLNNSNNNTVHIKSYNKGKGCVFEITAGIDRSYTNWTTTESDLYNKPKSNVQFPSFNGAALITYFYKNKIKNVTVTGFYSLPPVNYP